MDTAFEIGNGVFAIGGHAYIVRPDMYGVISKRYDSQAIYSSHAQACLVASTMSARTGFASHVEGTGIAGHFVVSLVSHGFVLGHVVRKQG